MSEQKKPRYLLNEYQDTLASHATSNGVCQLHSTTLSFCFFSKREVIGKFTQLWEFHSRRY